MQEGISENFLLFEVTSLSSPLAPMSQLRYYEYALLKSKIAIQLLTTA
jgi:hypothetical protein